MNKELVLKLIDAYPALMRDIGGEPGTTHLDGGIEVGDGWYPLINYFCHAVTTIVNSNPREFEGVDNEIVIWKITRNGRNGMLIYNHGKRNSMIQNIRESARKMSVNICENCGVQANEDTQNAEKTKEQCKCNTTTKSI